MEILKVFDSKSGYKVYIDSNFDSFYNIFMKYKDPKQGVFVITDSIVSSCYCDILDDLRIKFKAKLFVFNEGEENKNFDTIKNIYNFLIDNNADRNSIVIAFGGGIVGDIAGFAAATYMRGMKFINIPTTLTSQVDSSIGGKVGYNYNNIKNAIGSFYNPEFVYISTAFLKSLNRNQLMDGTGEIIKYGLINNSKMLEFIDENFSKIFELESEEILYIVKECLTIKAEIISKDYKDTGLRNILNFGHTIGHGIEVDSDYSISHGIAVALGILVAVKLSEKQLNTSQNVYNYLESLYKKISIPVKYKVDNYQTFLYAIRHDKKNDNSINFVLLQNIGDCKIKMPVSEEEVLWAVNNSINNI
jgi:3-dehydroquinate synthase